MEFDKTKILTVVTANQLKEGQLGWINDTVEYLKSDIQNIRPYKVFSTNENIVDFPFTAEYRGTRRYFYPAPEPTYTERQAEWVKENGVKKGTRIRITKDYGKDSDAYTIGYIGVAGRCGTVSDVGDSHINVYLDCEEGYFITVPYYAMEVIKEPNYRPYNNDELNNLVGEILTNKQWVEELDGKKHMLKAVEPFELCQGCLFNCNQGGCCWKDFDSCHMGNYFIIKDLGILNKDGCLPAPWDKELYPDFYNASKTLWCIHAESNDLEMKAVGNSKQEAIDAWNRRT